ncbi:hypothetical protein [Catenisphaera adipataccumulans]|jgi:hypothetical protein|uniref:Uncharacterized protein n=1 Tax=Catenisphaera adipataccumulans TaxID=700500 RepID=A0A7W8D110_9FIRM|nr:hypothetical protein [Catenisphaera adipataccumulans]MBB5183575.1 hypothetical protein [Catenisphaera adipataccumulans]
MWKYRCKSHLITLLISFAGGVLLMALALHANLDSYRELVNMVINTYEQSGVNQLTSAQSAAMSKYLMAHPEIFYIVSGLSISGFFNLILLAQWLMSQYNVHPLVILFLVFLVPDLMFMIGAILVIPMIIVCIYGMVTLRTSVQSDFRKASLTAENEILKVYRLHHEFREDVKPIVDEVRHTERRVTAIYALGVVAVIVVTVMISNFWVLLIAFLFFMFAFNYLLHYRANAVIPMAALLYEQCDPEACASAVFLYSKRGRRLKLRQQTLLAQSLIYLDDAELAQDVLITYPRKDQASMLQYWSLMAYVDYLLKDDDALQRCKEEAAKIQLRYGRTGVMIQSEELRSIQNKIDLMNGELNVCRKYYLEAYRKAKFPFQRVDASYYIGLISFVEEDYPLAKMYFEKVTELGNKMSFVKRAQKYLEKIQGMHIDTDMNYES